MSFLAFTLDDVVDIINNALRGLFGFLCEIIYSGIASLYDMFKELGAQAYRDEFVVIYNKISLIIGIFMVFRVTFWLIEALVNPDSMSDKEKKPGKIIQKVLITVVLLATTPTIFEKAFDLQETIIESNIIENIISVGTKLDGSTTAGRYLSAELFLDFYTPTLTEDGEIAEVSHCVDRTTGVEGSAYRGLLDYGKLNLDSYCLSEKINDDQTNEFTIDFNGLFATGVGIFVFWMILMYCISLGTRYVQLIYLQIIAPIPIMCYLAPSKDNMFSKWVKQCTTTYLDLFIRLAIINFVMLLCTLLLSNNDGIIDKFGAESSNGFITIFLILGLLTFAKKAPELIQELLPKSITKASGDFGLSLKKRSESMLGGKFAYSTLKRAPGYVAGGVGGALLGGAMGIAGGKGVGSRTAGFFSGAARGFATGSKKGGLIKNLGEVKKNQSAQNSKLQQWRISAGKSDDEANTFGDWASRRSDAGRKAIGFERTSEQLDRSVKRAQDMQSTYKDQKNYKKGKLREENTRVYIERKDANGKTVTGFMTMTQLDADEERLREVYNTFDQTKDAFIAGAKSRVAISKDEQTTISAEADKKLQAMSQEEKKNLIMRLYGSNEAAAEKELRDDPKGCDDDIKKALLAEETEKLKDQKAQEMFETERQKAFDEWDRTKKAILDNEDFADFTYSAQHITHDKGKREMFMNEIEEYNAFVSSQAPEDLKMSGLAPITEKQINDAYTAFENGDVSELQRLSKMYNSAMKSIPTKITSLKSSKEYERASAASKFNGN